MAAFAVFIVNTRVACPLPVRVDAPLLAWNGCYLLSQRLLQLQLVTWDYCMPAKGYDILIIPTASFETSGAVHKRTPCPKRAKVCVCAAVTRSPRCVGSDYVPVGFDFLRRGVWGAVDFIKKFWEWCCPPPECPSPPPGPQTTLVSADTLSEIPYFD